MGMDVKSLAIPEVKVITPPIFRDKRGFFSETYNLEKLAAVGIDCSFPQDNHSLSRARGTVRGLHFQIEPHPQGKLVRVVRGAVFDVAVDIRHGSPAFGKHVCCVLSSENWSQVWVPSGFAHGFCTLEPDTEVVYKVTDLHSPQCERGIAFDDAALGIDWPIAPSEAVVSEKDRRLAKLSEVPAYFFYP
jgi:dTDP-4-dehydrorhamnose 3,5-epimerase